MTLDTELIAETRGWIEKAQHDLRMAELALGDSHPLTDQAVFHAQQAAEKTLKSFLTWHRQPFRKTHHLEELGEQCLAINATLRAPIDRAVPLTEYAWHYRYPSADADPPSAEADEALVVARALLSAILALLPGESQP